jgi:hypothetical protein
MDASPLAGVNAAGARQPQSHLATASVRFARPWSVPGAPNRNRTGGSRSGSANLAVYSRLTITPSEG